MAWWGKQEDDMSSAKGNWILGVSIKYKGEIHKIPKPFRHHHLLHGHDDGEFIRDSSQGFYTDKVDFLSREEAAILAKAVGQYEGSNTRLYSEDLW